MTIHNPWNRKQTPVRRNDDYELLYPVAPLSDFNRLFDNFFGNLPATVDSEFMPSIDVRDKDKVMEVTAELPGVNEKDITVTIAHNILTIAGEKRYEKEETREGHRMIERRYGSFARSIPLPPYLETDKVDASFKDGVLKISMPKSSEYQQSVRSIPINSSKAEGGNGGGKTS